MDGVGIRVFGHEIHPNSLALSLASLVRRAEQIELLRALGAEPFCFGGSIEFRGAVDRDTALRLRSGLGEAQRG